MLWVPLLYLNIGSNLNLIIFFFLENPHVNIILILNLITIFLIYVYTQILLKKKHENFIIL